MSCSINLFSLLGEEPSEGGTWTFVGYDAGSPVNPQGSAPSGYSTPTGLGNPGELIDIQTNGWPSGFYQFNYAVGAEPCNDDVNVVIQVIDGCTVPPNHTINLCSGAGMPAPFNVNTYLADYTGPGNQGTAGCLIDSYETIPAALVEFWDGVAGVLTITEANTIPEEVYTIQVNLAFDDTSHIDYDLADCDNCQGGSFNIIVDVAAGFSAGTPILVAACNHGGV